MVRRELEDLDLKLDVFNNQLALSVGQSINLDLCASQIFPFLLTLWSQCVDQMINHV